MFGPTDQVFAELNKQQKQAQQALLSQKQEKKEATQKKTAAPTVNVVDIGTS